MVPWIERPTLSIDLSADKATQFAGIPTEAVEQSRTLLDAVLMDAPDIAKLAIPLVQQVTKDRYQQEFEEMGEAFDVDWRRLLLASVSYDLVIASLACSTLALATSDGPVLARNMDWAPEDKLARASYLLEFNDADGLQFANAGWPGSAGVVTGMSARGFAIALNAVGSPEGLKPTGYPVMLHIRRVLEDAANFNEARDMLSRETLAVSGLFTLVGRTNEERAVIERSPTKSAIRTANGDEPLITTNHYIELYPEHSSGEGKLFSTACARFSKLGGYFSGPSSHKPITDEELLYALTDPGVMQQITAQHVIARPAENSIRMFVPRQYIASESGSETLRSIGEA